jgi:chromosome segregation ATPase
MKEKKMEQTEETVRIRERLTSLETKLSFIQVLLQEIRDELKDHPTKEDYDSLEERVHALEKSQTTLAIKVGIASGVLGFIGGILVKVFLG